MICCPAAAHWSLHTVGDEGTWWEVRDITRFYTPSSFFTLSFVSMQVTKDLLLRILGRDLATPETVAQWIQLRFNEQEKRTE